MSKSQKQPSNPQLPSPKSRSATEIAQELLEIAERFSGLVDLEKREQELKDSLRDLKDKQDRITSEAVEKRHNELTALDAEISQVGSRLAAANKDFGYRSKQLEREYHDKQDALDMDYRKRAQGFEKQIKGKSIELDNLNQHLSDTSRNLQALETRIGEEQATSSELSQSISTLTGRQTKLTEELSSLESRTKTARNKTTEAELARDRAVNLAREAEAELLATKEHALQEVEEIKAAANAERNRFRTERTRLQVELNSLNKLIVEKKTSTEVRTEEMLMERQAIIADRKALQEERRDFEADKRRAGIGIT